MSHSHGTVRNSTGGVAPGLRNPDTIIQKSRFSLRQEKKRILERRATAIARSVVLNGERCSCADGKDRSCCCCGEFEKHNLTKIVIHPEEAEGQKRRDLRYPLRTDTDGVEVWGNAPRQATVVLDGCPKLHVRRLIRREFDAGYFVVGKPDRLGPGEPIHLVMNPVKIKCRRCDQEKPECCFRTKDVCRVCVGELMIW